MEKVRIGDAASLSPVAVNNVDANALARPVHVAFCVDNHYFRSMGATIVSILNHNPARSFVFHVFAFAVAPEHRERLHRLQQNPNVVVFIHIIDPAVFKSFSSFIASTYYSPSIFIRLLIAEVLKQTTDRVLYLDADILCHGNIDELVNMDFDGAIAVVAPDADATTSRRSAALGLSAPRYFNSGVMLMNVPAWIDHRIAEETVAAILQNGENYRFPDQDALNVVLDGRVHYVDAKWNFLHGLVGDLEKDIRSMRPLGDARFIHFAGAVKPWHDWCLHESRELFIRYHRQSPWSDVPLDPVPQNYKEMRMHSRFLLRRGSLIEGIRWYLRYLKARKVKLAKSTQIEAHSVVKSAT